ncbi:C-C motif chemokine 2-like [Pundamilia nyererei]|uniref:C-C motif chemokine 2-like n=1 Tax=Pundamilia nyererei TaxID=303518 RepID=A0A9Y3QPE8_9CICH|nr:PREDICTED: C-C motif chemokine 2-like [Pundamilia nyererei]
MQSSLIVAALLCFTTWMSSDCATPISIRSCCLVWSKTRVSLDRIVNYSIQTEDTCLIKAVQLRTVLGKTICANPDADWTRKAIEKVDRENSQKGFASDMIPTTSTASPASGNIPQKDKGTGQSLIMFCQIHCGVDPWTKNMLCPTN